MFNPTFSSLSYALRLLFLSILFSSFALAGTTGKISGVVKDKKTGEPLIGANIKVEGTSLGASTDIDGRYNIINIPPGDYSIVASIIGYTTEKITAVRVRIDLTTTIDIELSETVVQLGQEVVVVAERPLVQKDLTAKTAIVSGKEIADLPVTEVGSVLSLQAGFVAGSLRGGRSGEVAYWIDGVPLTDAYNGSQVVEVNKSLVQEMQLVSGAFNAEYGQAMSGIVNIATREGGSRFTGGIGLYGGDYATSDRELFPGLKFRPADIRNYEGNLSGPLIGEDVTFFVNGRYIYFNGDVVGFRRFNPDNIAYTDTTGYFHLNRGADGRGDSSAVPMNWSRRSYLQGKIAWKVTPLIKLTLNYIFDHTTAKAFTREGSFGDKRSYFYNPDGYGNSYNTSNTAIMQFTHTLSNSTFYTIGGSLFVKNFTYGLYNLQYRDTTDAAGNPLGAYEVWNPFGQHYVHPKLFLTPDSYSFLTGGTDMDHFDRTTTSGLVKFDVTSQMDATNLVKFGVEVRGHRFQVDSYTLQPVPSQSDINILTDSPYIRTYIPDVSSNYHSKYDRRPSEFSAYVQDKMEFKDVIVNIGVRYDYFQPDGYVLRDPSDPNIYDPIKNENRFKDLNGNGVQDPGEPDVTLAERQSYWYNRATAKHAVSPRLGVSFPITARGIVHFSYGHFFQIPRFELLYENPDFKIGQGTGNQGVVGNANLEPEQTISGEIGVQQQLTDDISVDVTAYLRDIRNLTGTRGDQIVVFGGASSYSKYQNSDFGFVKGIVLTLDKRFSSGFSSTLDYTYQVAKGSASDPQEARNALAGGALPEVQLNPLGWDQRHTLNVTLGYTTEHWGISGIAQYGTGTPYTPRSSTDVSTILTNSQLKPSFFTMDLRAYYELKMDALRFVFFTRVFNLFDIRNEVNVYNDTGRAGFTTDETAAEATRPRQYINTIQQWFSNATYYSEPRRIEFGVNVEF